MIIQKKQLEEYLGRQLSDLEGKLHKQTLNKLKEAEQKMTPYFKGSLIDYLFLEHQQGYKSLRYLSKEIGTNTGILSRIFDIYNLPQLTQAEATRKNWEDDEFRKRHAEAVRKNWEDDEFRKRHAEAVRKMLDKRWEDDEFRKRNAEATRKNWEDDEFRKRQAEAVRQARKSEIPRIKGYRIDIQRNAKTTAEANLVRTIMYCNRKESGERAYELNIPEEYKKFFKTNKTKITLDSLTPDSRENLKGYLILPRPQQKSYIKAELLREQYGIIVTIITEEKYKRVESWFSKKIENDGRFKGWETEKDNLKTNPKKYKITLEN